MHIHRSSCLDGPVSGSREWWRPESSAAAPDSNLLDEAPVQDDDPGFRADQVARIRREIAEGTYDTPEKWEQALDRLQDRLEGRDS